MSPDSPIGMASQRIVTANCRPSRAQSLSALPEWLPEPHAQTAAVFVKEVNTTMFKCIPYFCARFIPTTE